MKEATQRNEEFLLQQERLASEGKSRKEREAAAIEEFENLKNSPNPSHAFRAWLARLADPDKFKSKGYSSRAKALQKNRNNKTEPAATAVAVEDTPVEANA